MPIPPPALGLNQTEPVNGEFWKAQTLQQAHLISSELHQQSLRVQLQTALLHLHFKGDVKIKGEKKKIIRKIFYRLMFC